MNSLFEMWDNDGSGMLDLDEVDTVMKKYKEGLENEAIEKGTGKYRKTRPSKKVWENTGKRGHRKRYGKIQENEAIEKGMGKYRKTRPSKKVWENTGKRGHRKRYGEIQENEAI